MNQTTSIDEIPQAAGWRAIELAALGSNALALGATRVSSIAIALEDFAALVSAGITGLRLGEALLAGLDHLVAHLVLALLVLALLRIRNRRND
jgi:hypothetical protein